MSTYDVILENVEAVLDSLMKSNDKTQYSNITKLIEIIEAIRH